MQVAARQQSNALVVLFSAFLATVSAILGHDAIACSGFLSGAISALMRACFLVFVHPLTLVVCACLLGALAGIARCLAVSRLFRERKELLLFILPLSALLGGIAVGVFADLGVRCALHPWAVTRKCVVMFSKNR